MDRRTLPQKLFGFCPSCGRWFRRVKTIRQNSAYLDDSLNFFTGCKRCHEDNDAYWDEMWAEYGGPRS